MNGQKQIWDENVVIITFFNVLSNKIWTVITALSLFYPSLWLALIYDFNFKTEWKNFYILFFFLYPNRMSKLKTLHRPGQTEWPSVHWFIIFSHKLSIFLKSKLQTGDKITKLHSRPESKCLKFSNQSKKHLTEMREIYNWCKMLQNLPYFWNMVHRYSFKFSTIHYNVDKDQGLEGGNNRNKDEKITFACAFIHVFFSGG